MGLAVEIVGREVCVMHGAGGSAAAWFGHPPLVVAVIVAALAVGGAAFEIIRFFRGDGPAGRGSMVAGVDETRAAARGEAASGTAVESRV
jgi:hypothetical protein